MSHVLVTRIVALGCFTPTIFALACGSPSPVGPSSKLTVTSVFPNTGSQVGSIARIGGSGFAAGLTVTIDGTATPAVVLNPSVAQLTMPAHALGSVDITVRAASGETATLAGAFTYVHVDPPAVTSVTPASGFPFGGNRVTVVGSGFQSETTVTFGAIVAGPQFDGTRTSTSLPVFAPPHAVGAVDLVVTNPDGQTSVIPAGYVYAASESFDFNGVWKGFTWEFNTTLTFTIQNNLLVSVACGTVTHTFSPAATVSGGLFSVTLPDISMSGQLSSPTEAFGLLAMPGCSSSFGWSAYKDEPRRQRR